MSIVNRGYRSASVLLLIVAAVAVVWASSGALNYQCVDDVSGCPDFNDPVKGNGSSGWGGCGPAGGNSWSFGDDEPMYIYGCNGRSLDCGTPGSLCNVWAETMGRGRYLTCTPAGSPVVFCMTAIYGTRALNKRCDNGQKCNPDGPADNFSQFGGGQASTGLWIAVATPEPATWVKGRD
jgi:hypothetical protein